MTCLARSPRCPIVVAVVLLLSALARADVHDDAHLFGPQALDDANTVTAQMERQYGKQLVVETFAAVPADRRAAALADKPGFFKAWMAGRAKDLKVNGVYVMICMDPKYVETGAGAQTRARHIFTADDLTALRRQLQADLRAERYDDALSRTVLSVARTYAASIPGAKPLDEPEPAATTRPATRPAP